MELPLSVSLSVSAADVAADGSTAPSLQHLATHAHVHLSQKLIAAPLTETIVDDGICGPTMQRSGGLLPLMAEGLCRWCLQQLLSHGYHSSSSPSQSWNLHV